MTHIERLCVVAALCASACGPHHVNLKAPTADAAPEERMKAYEQLAPTSVRVTRFISKYGSSESVDSLRLSDGRRVYYAEDLLPVVHPSSQAAADILEIEDHAAKARYTLLGGIAATVVGSVLMVVDLSHQRRGVPFYGGAVLGLGGVIAIPISSFFGAQASHARNSAFLNYDEGLRQRLDLCRGDEEVGPCH